MDWLKKISWLRVVAHLAGFVAYIAGWMVAAVLCQLLFAHTLPITVASLFMLVTLGAFMSLGRDMIAKPLNALVFKLIAGEPLTGEEEEDDDDSSKE